MVIGRKHKLGKEEELYQSRQTGEIRVLKGKFWSPLKRKLTKMCHYLRK